MVSCCLLSRLHVECRLVKRIVLDSYSINTQVQIVVVTVDIIRALQRLAVLTGYPGLTVLVCTRVSKRQPSLLVSFPNVETM